MKRAFGDFVSQIDSDGVLILKKGTEIPLDKLSCKTFSYSYDNRETDFHAFNIELQPHSSLITPHSSLLTQNSSLITHHSSFKFDIRTPFGTIDNCTLGLPGWVNIENAVAAVAASVLAGADKDGIRDALSTFSGVKRRFDTQVNTPEHVYIDDYAHHPEELKAAITSVRQMFAGRKISGIFQPHLYTRTRDFAAGFAESLNLLDELILLDIYPARELPIEGVTSEIIFDKVRIKNKTMCTMANLMNLLANRDIDVLITLGAGDIDRFVEPITKLLSPTTV
jgi:UDP-N-acetylmuramate--alanine ligase